MKYDITLKALFQQVPQQLFNILIGQQPQEILNVEYPAVRNRRPDFVSRLKDGSLYHLELQSDNDDNMLMRMLEYFFLIKQQYNQSITQQVLYVGRDKINMSAHLSEKNLQFSYQLVDIREIDCAPLLQSSSLEDNLLAILCKIERKTETIRTLLQKIAKLHGNARLDALEKLQILANLRSIELRQTLKQEVKNMPITIDTRETIWYQDGFLEGEHKGRLEGEHKGRLEGEHKGRLEGEHKGRLEGESLILQRQLTRRFGNLPGWATQRISQAQEEQLELWSLRILEVDKLEDVFTSPLQ